jgi:histidinol-phosphate aminotransferase
VVSLSDLPLRDDLKGATPYGAPQDAVRYALNVNENTHPIPEPVARDIVESLARAVLGANRYPDREFLELREAFAGYLGHGLVAGQIWAANGSNEIIQHVLQAFGGPGRTVLGFPPTYSMHPIIAAGTGTQWVTAERDAGYTISPETAVAAIERTDPDRSSSALRTTPPALPCRSRPSRRSTRRRAAWCSSTRPTPSSCPTRCRVR